MFTCTNGVRALAEVNVDLSSGSSALTSASRGKRLFLTSKKRPGKAVTGNPKASYEGLYCTVEKKGNDSSWHWKFRLLSSEKSAGETQG